MVLGAWFTLLIEGKNLATRVIAGLTRLIAWIFYRSRRIGAVLPAGPVLLVANHPNALLDPALIWATAGRDIRFLAKSTLFHGNPLSPLMRRSGAIPVYRRVDPGVDPSRNVEMFAAVDAALAAGDAVCLFPEGLSHSTGHLEQLKTGAARIALAAAATGVRVAIVPVGLNFDRKATFRSRVTVVYGAPFFCDDLVHLQRRDQASAVRMLTVRIAEHVRGLMVEADPRTDAEIVERIDRLHSAARGIRGGAAKRIERRRFIAAGLERLRQGDGARYEAIREQVRAYDARMARFGLKDRDVDLAVARRAALRFVVRETIAAAVLVPVCVLGLLVFAIPYWVTDWIARHWSFEARGTAKVIGGGVVYGLWCVALAATAGWLHGRTAALATVAALPALAVAGLLAIERETAVAEAVRSYLATTRLSTRTLGRLRRRRAEIAGVLEQTYEWLEGSP